MSEPIEIIFKLTAQDIIAADKFILSSDPLEMNRVKLWLISKLSHRLYKRRDKKDPTDILPLKHIFDNKGVQVTNPQEIRTETWNYFSEVLEYREGYLFTKEKQILLLVPKRVFPSQYVHANFRNLLRQEMGINAKLNILL
jgi:hypothetical protein